jgi:hypothetical protein
MSAALKKEIVMYQNYSRYRAGDFERRWQARLKAPRQRTSSQLEVVVTHRFPAPNRYGWELRPPTAFRWKNRGFNSRRGKKPVRPESSL